MESKSLQSLCLPSILFGSERQVQKAWRKVVRRAWKVKQWSIALADVEMVPAHDVDGLLVSSSSLLRSAHPDCWRMYVVGEAFKDVALDVMSPGAEEMDEFDALLLHAMNWLWFTIGLFEICGRFNLSNFPRTRPIIDVLYDYVDRFAHWLPELVGLESLFFDDLRLAGPDSGYRCPWALNIVSLAADCDVTLPLDASNSGKVLVDSLLNNGLIEPFGDRYRARRS